MPGVLEEAMLALALNQPLYVVGSFGGAASMIGDDRLQREAQGYVVPDSFTHGSSKQRVDAFRAGLKSGDLSQLGVFFDGV